MSLKNTKQDLMVDVEWVATIIDKKFNNGMMTKDAWNCAEQIVRVLYKSIKKESK